MKKFYVGILCFFYMANSVLAEFSFTKCCLKKNTSQVKIEQEKTEKSIKYLFKSKKSSNEEIKNESQLIHSEKNVVKKSQTNSQKDNIFFKNKFIKSFSKSDKSSQEVTEEVVSKEQIRAELLKIQEISEQAVALYNDNNLEEALDTFLKIPEKYRTAQDYVLMGNILYDLEKPEDAVFMYKRAILINESFYKSYYNIGNICLNDDKYFMAIDYYKKTIKYAPDFAYGYYNLACAYIKAGELGKAKSKLIKAIELKNTEADFHYNLAYVYKKLNKPKLANIYLENYNKLTNGL